MHLITSDAKFRALIEAGWSWDQVGALVAMRIRLRLQAERRLIFARYLVATGRLSDGVPARKAA